MKNDVRIFGMPAEQGRWVLVLLGLVINLCLGTVYAWSVFRKPLETLFKANATQSALPFVFFLAFFAILMPFAGRLLDRYSPRVISMAGGIVVSLGWIFSRLASDMTVLSITYGVIAGSGVGISYGVPIAVCTRWFPDRKGLAVGLTLLGFGMSAMITAPLAKTLIASSGPQATFAYLGIAFLLITVILSIPMRFPPAGWKPRGWTPDQAASALADFNPRTMLATSSFYGLWACYIIGTLTGLMAIGIASPCAQELVQCGSTAAAVAVSIFAVFNGLGRPLFGWLTDRVAPRKAAILSFVVILLSSLIMLIVQEGDMFLYILAFCGFWLTLGGWLAIAPTATATFFGTKSYAKNYGILFSSYGIGAIIGNLLSSQLKDLLGSYRYAFYPTAVLALIGMVIAVFFLKPPRTGPVHVTR
jgi:OFA family oxalate/formate antiporter-like MFS transporter